MRSNVSVGTRSTGYWRIGYDCGTYIYTIGDGKRIVHSGKFIKIWADI